MGALLVAAASAARTTSGNSGTLSGFGDWTKFRAALNVTAASGTTPTLDVVIEDSLDGGTTWFTVATFSQKTAAGTQAQDVTGVFSDTLRVRWTIGGTSPSFTFDVRLYGK
ncbi:hypothetical protein [Streptomyces sp. NPDC007264]|uniref:hypothetical protein n=1 Tax=Streptomyces sp. NPDC007264 TaxID=3364777 RepID=UPI0036DD460F